MFAVHDADYRQSQKDFNAFVDSLTEKITEKDGTIPELPHKDLVRLKLFLSEVDQLEADLLSIDVSNISGHTVQSRSNSI